MEALSNLRSDAGEVKGVLPSGDGQGVAVSKGEITVKSQSEANAFAISVARSPGQRAA
jgi:hypothetical protein